MAAETRSKVHGREARLVSRGAADIVESRCCSVPGRAMLARLRAGHITRPIRFQRLALHSAGSRLLSTLAVLEQREGQLHHGSLSSVTAASKLGGPVTGIIAASAAKKVAEQAAKVPGLQKVIFIDNDAYDKVRHVPGKSVKRRIHGVVGSA